MMKSTPGLWVLLSAGVLLLCLQGVNGVRATSLIFAKSTTTTTTTTTEESVVDENAESSTDIPLTANTTKSPLTGIPQQDYLLDPNLPQEINGYNLTEYPFYSRVPDEEILFKCDGLHDGFYASIPHKCQVYHHCLYGTRYDFLCANYTAFDQKTFICQFVSVVDCVNSKKYWHRNDALYEATTTTTVKPVIVTTTTARPAPRRRPAGRRRRPQYDYYDYEEYEEYEERPQARRRPRPRPRPRPAYEEDYEEEPYERRKPTRRRTNKDRRKYEYEEAEEPERRTVKRRPGARRPADEPEGEAATKPSGGSIYDRPRAAPRVKPPVPKSEANKYAYKPAGGKKQPEVEEEEYDEYEEEVVVRKVPNRETRKQANSRPRVQTVKVPEESTTVRNRKRTRPSTKRTTTTTVPPPAVAEAEYYDYEEEPAPVRSSTSTTSRPTTTKEVPRSENVVRIVKRPFLASRGGNPLQARGLQPVGAKAPDEKVAESEPELEPEEEEEEVKSVFKPSPAIVKVPAEAVEGRHSPQRANFKTGPRTTQKPKVLELIEDYDVTLNDALNPTLPNLPVRAFPTGFSAGDYQQGYNQRGSNRFEAGVGQQQPHDGFIVSNKDYKGQYSTIQAQSYRPSSRGATYYSTY